MRRSHSQATARAPAATGPDEPEAMWASRSDRRDATTTRVPTPTSSVVVNTQGQESVGSSGTASFLFCRDAATTRVPRLRRPRRARRARPPWRRGRTDPVQGVPPPASAPTPHPCHPFLQLSSAEIGRASERARERARGCVWGWGGGREGGRERERESRGRWKARGHRVQSKWAGGVCLCVAGEGGGRGP